MFHVLWAIFMFSVPLFAILLLIDKCWVYWDTGKDPDKIRAYGKISGLWKKTVFYRVQHEWIDKNGRTSEDMYGLSYKDIERAKSRRENMARRKRLVRELLKSKRKRGN